MGFRESLIFLIILALLAFFVIKFANKNNEMADGEEKDYKLEGMMIGMVIGAAVGIADGHYNPTVELFVGFILGMIIGKNIKKH